jgi:hypothetical protein
MLPLDRRSFLASATSALAVACGRNACPSQLYVNKADWLSIPYESEQLEIVGATEDGMAVLPNMDQALLVEAKRVLDISLTRESIHNVVMIDECGLYCVYIWTFPAWKKYRLWNYPAYFPLDHCVTYAG